MAKRDALADRVIQLPGTGGCGKNQVTVKGGVARHQRAGKAVMRGNGQPLALRLVERRIGGDDTDGRVLGRCQAARQRHIGSGTGRRRAEATKFTALFPWRGPQMRHPVRRRRAMRVHRDQRADRHTVVQHCRG